MSNHTPINPDALPKSPAFSQGVLVHPNASLLFVGGQNGIDAGGRVVSVDAHAQTTQALHNVAAVIAAAGGTIDDIVRWTITVTDRASLGPGFAAFRAWWGMRASAPAVTVQIVAGLARPDCLVEIDAIAAIGARRSDGEP